MSVSLSSSDTLAFGIETAADNLGGLELPAAASDARAIAAEAEITEVQALEQSTVAVEAAPLSTYTVTMPFVATALQSKPGAEPDAETALAAPATGPIAAVPPTISISLSGSTYTQNFDTLLNTGTGTIANTPDGWTFAEAGTAANTSYSTGTGSGTAGDTYSFGASGSTDRAFGTLLSGSNSPTIGAAFTNDTGGTITDLLIAYTGEQWRLGAVGRPDRLDFQYSLDATSLTTGTWIDVDALDFNAPVSTGATGLRDGNLTENRTAISSTIAGLSLANGQTVWIRWSDFNATSSDDGLAIDDFSLTATAVGAQPSLSISDATVVEGDAGTVNLTYTVTLSGPAGAGGVTFDIATADGTATTTDGDYVAQALTGVTIPEGQTTYTFTVVVNSDTAFELDETVFVNVTNVTGALVTDGQGVGTITNDDAPDMPVLDIGPSTLSQSEGNAGETTTYSFTVTRSGDTSGAVTVDYAVTGSGASAATASDFVGGQLPSGTVTFEAGQTTATITIQVAGDTTFEQNEGFTVTLSNASSGGLISTATAEGVILNDDYTPIYEIQGEGHFSAYNGQAVTTQGVVTGVVTVGSARGYYIQDVNGDGNMNTSDAVFVFTGGVSPTVTVGQLLSVSGTVTEFRASGALSLTEITGATATVIGTAELPDAIVIGSGDGMRAPPSVSLGDNDITGVFDPATQGSDFWETMEGMRVTISDAISVSPYKNSNGEIWVRSGTAETNSVNDRGGLTISDTTPDTVNPADKIFDFNPERIKLNDTISSLPSVSAVGDKLGDVTGIVSYNFGSYEVLNTAPVTVTQASTLEKEVTTIEASLDTVRVASFNVRNLSPVGTQDGEGSDGSTAAEMRARAEAIVENLGSPDIIALQELQDNNGTLNDSNTDASQTLQELIDAIVAAGGPRYKAIDSNPADDQDGGVGGGNIRVAYLYNPEAVTPTAANGLVQDAHPDVFEYNPANRIGVGDADYSATRKSMPIEWAPAGYTATEGGTFYVINNHFSSKGGSATLYGTDMGNPQYGEPVNSGAVKREGQAIAVKEFIDGILNDGNAMNDKFVVLGDFNDFQFFPVVQLVTGQLVRTSIGNGNTDSTFAAGTQILQSLSDHLSATERYSYNFEGNAQALDQVLVSANLFATTVYDIVHMNSEFADQISDHDPAIAALLMPRSAALATAGNDVFDQATFTARFGATRGSLAGDDRISGLAGDDIIVSGDGDDILNGDEGNDTLMAGAGNDRLDGGTGADNMAGGTGDDTYIVDDAGDVVAENANEGEDTVITALASYTLTANVERLIGTGNGQILIGNAGNNSILGSIGDDIIIGGAGADAINGDAGVDAIDYGLSIAGVTIDLAAGTGSGGDAEGDTFLSIENVTGSYFADVITGNAANNALFGGKGSDTLTGGAGDDVLVGHLDIFEFEADTLSGGDGDDLMYGEAVDTLSGGAGYDRLIAINALDFTLDMGATSIEYAVLDYGDDVVTAASQTQGVSVFASGGDDQVTGSAFDDLMFGGVGDDILLGGDGDDALVGEAGLDTLTGGNGNDRIYFDSDDIISGGDGFDVGYVTAGSGVSLNMEAASIEYVVDQAGGNDWFQGTFRTESVSIYAGAGNDTAQGGSGDDVLWGEAGDDILVGGAGQDTLVGGEGADLMNGGFGRDYLYGGANDGAQDLFRFTTSGEANWDFVYDFEAGVDKIDVRGLSSTFGDVTMSEADGNTAVFINGQQIALVVGVTGLVETDFLFNEAVSQKEIIDVAQVRPDGPEVPMIWVVADPKPGLIDMIDTPDDTRSTWNHRVTPADFDWVF